MLHVKESGTFGIVAFPSAETGSSDLNVMSLPVCLGRGGEVPLVAHWWREGGGVGLVVLRAVPSCPYPQIAPKLSICRCGYVCGGGSTGGREPVRGGDGHCTWPLGEDFAGSTL